MANIYIIAFYGAQLKYSVGFEMRFFIERDSSFVRGNRSYYIPSYFWVKVKKQPPIT